jgi:hypothetical protein
MATTPVYGWETPDDTDYVYQGAAAARTTANSIDATLASLGQKVLSYAKNATALINTNSGTVNQFMIGTSCTVKPGRLYLASYGVGLLTKNTTAGSIIVSLTVNTAGGGPLDAARFDDRPVGTSAFTLSKTGIFSVSTTFTFIPSLNVQSSTGGYIAENTSAFPGFICITDIGSI